MTREEAIYFAECLKHNWTIDFNDMEDFCDMAIEALKGGDAEVNETKSPYMQQSRHDDGKIEVVRCKDCKHRSDGGWCDVYIQPRMDTDFCNYGERKGGDDE